MVAVRYEEIMPRVTYESASPVQLRLVEACPVRPRLVDSAGEYGQRELTLQRRRILAVFIAAVIALALLWSISLLAASHSTGATEVNVELPPTHVVVAGETIWGIVRDRNPQGDIRGEVDDLSQQLGGAGLQIGQVIRFDLGDETVASES